MGRLWASFRRHRRARAAGGAGAGGAVRVFAGDAVDHCGGGAGRLRAGFRHPAVLGAARRQVAHRDGEVGDRKAGRICRLHRGDQHHHHPARSGCADCGERAEVESVGRVHDRHDDADRGADGTVPAPHPPGKGAGGFAGGVRTGAGGDFRRAMGLADAVMGRGFHADCADTGDSHHPLRIRCFGVAGVAAAGATRLPEHVCGAGNDLAAGGGDRGVAALVAHAGADAFCRWDGAGVCGNNFSVRVHHHCVRRGQRISRADFERHNSEADPARARDAHGGLRWHGGGIHGGDHGDDCRVGAAAWGVLCGKQSSWNCGAGARHGGCNHHRVGISRHRGGDGFSCACRGRANVVQPDRRRAGVCGGHGAHFFQQPGRTGGDGALVSLRHHVRSVVHPDDSRCWNARRALHGAGRARTHLEAAGTDELVSVDSVYQRADRGRVGILPVARRERSAGRDQLAVAAVRDLQPVAGDGGAVRGHDDHHQDGASPLRTGDADSAVLAGGGDVYGGVSQGAESESADRISGACAATGGCWGRRAPGVQRPSGRGGGGSAGCAGGGGAG